MDETKNVLVIDDEKMIREVLFSFLEKKGFCVQTAENGMQGLKLWESGPFCFVILDLMLPDLSGEEICKIIRSKSNVPIIMLTAKTMEEDLLNGLALGADDYMVKPFSLKELYARMEAVLRRSAAKTDLNHSEDLIFSKDLEIDPEMRTVNKAGTPVSLTPIEWKLLRTFLSRPEKIFTREELLMAAFEDDFDGYDRVVDTHIKNLRKKLEDDPKNPVYIKTVHGIGYRFGGEKN